MAQCGTPRERVETAGWPQGVFLLLCVLVIPGSRAATAESGARSDEIGTESKFTDPLDGWLDVSAFLDTAYGFVPVVSPITEPAVGYGAAAALIFVDRNAPAPDGRFVRPNITAAGGLATENGTRGVLGGHLGSWSDGRIHTSVGFVDADVNLEFFGLGSGQIDGSTGVKYSIAATGGVAGASYRVGDSHAWLGLRYALADTSITPGWSGSAGSGGADRPALPAPDLDLRLGLLTPSVTLDTRDNFFTPTRGWYADVSGAFARGGLGSDRDFEKLDINVIHYRPIARNWYFGARGALKASSDGTPFFLRPFVVLRGVEAMRYQGEQAAEIEVETRWQFHPRFSALVFGGSGVARSSVRDEVRTKDAWGAGVGFRYLVARSYGMHMGIDVAQGPDEPIFYVVFGSAWLRP